MKGTRENEGGKRERGNKREYKWEREIERGNKRENRWEQERKMEGTREKERKLVCMREGWERERKMEETRENEGGNEKK